MTDVPERIWAAPPYDDPDWKSGAGEWDISEGWAVEQKVAYIPEDHSAALVAAAYEAVARKIEPSNPPDDWTEYARDCDTHARYIRALTPDDARASLDAMLAAARAEGLREAAALIKGRSDAARAHLGKTGNSGWSAVVSHLDLAEYAILALIPAEGDAT